MHVTRRLVLALAGALALADPGCATARPRRAAEDWRAALLAAVTHVERSALSPRSPAGPPAPLTLVVSGATPEALRQACEELRPTVHDHDLPDTGTVSLPAGHLQPQSLVITGDTAVFRGVLGPVPVAGPPAGRGGCGTTYQIRLGRQADGSWRVEGASTELCVLVRQRLRGRAA